MSYFSFGKKESDEAQEFFELVDFLPYGAAILSYSDDKIFVRAANDDFYELLGQKGQTVKKYPLKFKKTFPDFWNSDEIKSAFSKTIIDGKVREVNLSVNGGNSTISILVTISLVMEGYLLLIIENDKKAASDRHIINLATEHIHLIGELTSKLSEDIDVKGILKHACDRLKDIHNLYFTDAWLRSKHSVIDVTSPVYTNINSNVRLIMEKTAGVAYKDLKAPVVPDTIWEKLYINGEYIISDENMLPEILADFVSKDQIAIRKMAPLVAKLSKINFVMLVPMRLDKEVIGHIGFDAEKKLSIQDIDAIKLVVDKVASIIEIKNVSEHQIEISEQLRQSQKLEAVGHLAGGIAHDFNNLLTGIIGNTQLAQMEPELTPFTNELLNEVYLTSKKAAKLVKQLLAYSRKQTIYPKPVNINTLIRGMFNLLGRTLGDNIEAHLNVTDMDMWVLADSSQLEHVLLNLAVNSRDAMPSGGLFIIQIDSVFIDDVAARELDIDHGRYVSIKVKDTGVGMDTMTVENIFEPFFSTKEAGKGTGLGLAMVYGIIKQHKGTVKVASIKGKGTVFTIYLSQIDHELENRENISSVSSVPPAGAETILYVEDDQLVQKTTKRMLSMLGYQTICASSGEEAFSIADSYNGKIDLLLSDVVMPGINGFEIAEKLQSENSELKVLFVSGYSEDILPIKNNSQEIKLLAKPYTTTELANAIREIIDEN